MTDLSPEQIDTLKELLSIGLGKSSAVLNDLVNEEVTLQVPEIRIIDAEDLVALAGDEIPKSLASVHQDFAGPFSGSCCIAFPTESASILVSALTGENHGSQVMDSSKVETLTEVGNILLNSIMGTLANLLEQELDFSVPIYLEDELSQILDFSHQEGRMILAKMDFLVGAMSIRGDIFVVFSLQSFQNFLTALDGIS